MNRKVVCCRWIDAEFTNTVTDLAGVDVHIVTTSIKIQVKNHGPKTGLPLYTP
jgi:hypothetical protein